MKALTKDEVFSRKELLLREFKKCLFIYPTDTIYGIGCNALDASLVDRVRELKKRFDMPFSVIAPSKEWIRDFCEVPPKGEEWLDKLPGPYTLIFRMKRPEELPMNVTRGKDTLGVRIPNHWISKAVNELKLPIITTSANRTGENHMQKIDDISESWRDELDYVIYEGEISGSPSTLVHLYDEEVKVLER